MEGEIRRPHRTWKVLAGLTQPDFELEPALSLYRVRYWMTGVSTIQSAFRDAGRLYCLYRSQREMAAMKRGSPGRRLHQLMREQGNQQLFSDCFRRSDIPSILELPLLRRVVLTREKRWEYLFYNKLLTELRVIFTIHSGNWTKDNAEKYMRENKIGGMSLTKAGLKQFYRDRAAFVTAAYWSFGEDFTKFKFDDLFASDIPDPASFYRFCQQVRTIGKLLKCPGYEEIDRWTGIDPDASSLPEFALPAQDVLIAAKKGSNRTAEETSVGKRGRQQPIDRKP